MAVPLWCANAISNQSVRALSSAITTFYWIVTLHIQPPCLVSFCSLNQSKLAVKASWLRASQTVNVL